MAIPYAVKPTPRTVFGYPVGLVNLFLTEMWERFSFYGMRAILILFLVAPVDQGGMGLAAPIAASLYAVYNAVVYLLAMPGGWIADRLTGTRRAVLIGAAVIALGHYVLAVPSRLTVYLGLILVAVGTGLLKPNISTMVGELYDRLPGATPAQRDSGFSVYYVGIDIGAWAGVLVTGFLAARWGWHVGFAAAAVGMTIALVQYVVAGRALGDTGRDVHRPIDQYRRGLVVRRMAWWGLLALVATAAAALLLSLITGSALLDSVLLVTPPLIIAVPVLYFAGMLREHTLTGQERSRIHAYVPIFCGAALFWLIFDQSGNLLNLFADEKTDRTVFGYAFPASWFQSVNPLLILILAPLFALMWARLGERAPSTPVKFALGLLGIGSSFILLGAAGAAAITGLVSPLWLLGVYLVQTVAELFLSPVGLSVTTQLAPKRFASQMMGLWFLAVATGDAVGGYVVRLNALVGDTVYYGLLGLLGVAVGVAFWIGAGRVRTLMAGVT